MFVINFSVNKCPIFCSLYSIGTGLSFTVDAHVKGSPFKGGGAPTVIVSVSTDFENEVAFCCCDESKLKLAPTVTNKAVTLASTAHLPQKNVSIDIP